MAKYWHFRIAKREKGQSGYVEESAYAECDDPYVKVREWQAEAPESLCIALKGLQELTPEQWGERPS